MKSPKDIESLSICSLQQVLALEEKCQNAPHLQQQQIVQCNEVLFGQMLLDVCLKRLRSILESQNSMKQCLLSEISAVWAV